MRGLAALLRGNQLNPGAPNLTTVFPLRTSLLQRLIQQQQAGVRAVRILHHISETRLVEEVSAGQVGRGRWEGGTGSAEHACAAQAGQGQQRPSPHLDSSFMY